MKYKEERNHKKLRRLYREERFRSAMRSNQTMLLWDWGQHFMWASLRALGDFQRGLMLATAFAVLVLPTEAEAYTPEGRQACTGDAFRLCSAEIPSVDRVRACLHRNKAQLSPGCRGFISPGAHRPPPGGR